MRSREEEEVSARQSAGHRSRARVWERPGSFPRTNSTQEPKPPKGFKRKSTCELALCYYDFTYSLTFLSKILPPSSIVT